MVSEQKKIHRCAIYTRKSTEHNLDLEFNSLDAQREAAEAYIKSQAHEGWRCLPEQYDDGGLSGGTLERPALQELIAAIKAGRIDIIVVYKVDRLTRSLADFAKLIEVFDTHNVSFVSVTQAFNTTNSMGRLTLNVLLSFAQFEREVIGERVRDKISASKRKGLWVGGPVPMGYEARDKQLHVHENEAEQVRYIFRRYLELGSLDALLPDLRQRKIHTKARVQKGGRQVGGIPFRRGTLSYLLNNRFYIGEIAYQGKVYKGEHPAILDPELFHAVQDQMMQNRQVRSKLRIESQALLTGRLFDDKGNRMSPTHSLKKGVRYRAYVSTAVLQSNREQAGSVHRSAALALEEIILKTLCAHTGIETPPVDSTDQVALVEEHLQKVVLTKGELHIHMKVRNEQDQTFDDETTAVVTVSWSPPSYHRPQRRIETDDNGQPVMPETMRRSLIHSIAKAMQWKEEILAGRIKDFVVIAKREGKTERYIRMLFNLAYTPPSLVKAIVDGSAPADLTISALCNPGAWDNYQV